jgi:hypothetical protein
MTLAFVNKNESLYICVVCSLFKELSIDRAKSEKYITRSANVLLSKLLTTRYKIYMQNDCTPYK